MNEWGRPAVGWLALAAALLVVPGPSLVRLRTRTLVARGRLRGTVAASSFALGWRRSRARRGLHRQPGARGWRPDPRLAAAVAGLVLAAGVALAGGVALGLCAAVASATVAGVGLSAARRRLRSGREQALLGAVRLLVAEVEAGSRPAAALDAAALLSPGHAEALVAAGRAAREGADVGASLLTAGDPDLTPIAHAWRVSVSAGAPIAEVLGRVADDLAARREQRQAVATLLAGPRSSAVLLAGLPGLGIALGAAMGARPLAFLLGTGAGRLVCCVGVLLDAAGVLWTMRLMRRAELP